MYSQHKFQRSDPVASICRDIAGARSTHPYDCPSTLAPPVHWSESTGSARLSPPMKQMMGRERRQTTDAVDMSLKTSFVGSAEALGRGEGFA